MAGNQNSGGMRPTAPQNNPANVSATGGNGQSGRATQPARYISGLGYGEGQATMQQQTSAPMAGTPTAQAAAMSSPMMPMSAMGEGVTPLTAPTARPNEPLTAGMDFGAGVGSEALALPQERTLSQILANMIDLDPTGDAKDLYDFVVSRGL